MMGSLFVLFVIEMWLNARTGGHSHGGSTGEDVTGHGKSSWSKEHRYQNSQDTLTNDHDSATGQTLTPTTSGSDTDLEQGDVDPEVYRKMSLNITLLEGGILFHSVFVGMTVSIETKGFVVLLIAILFHQSFEGLGLGSRIAAVPYPKGSIRPWLLVFAFGTTAPIGQAIGLIARSSYDPNSAFALILVGTFNAISSGLLIYAALVDLLAEDFLGEEGEKMSKRQKIWAFCFVMMGAAGMSIVGAFA
ncbi:hypothetical protein Plec18167_009664 [Paecilomyces lecythidis]|uniref:Uncharacterized protein n=1 Tax=Paecilomyces lecythidis TaxID=3004212 RepID=A0ABR3WMM7_9EURO